MQGIVKFFNKAKSFGFICTEDNKEIFVHASDTEDGILLDGQHVEYEIDLGPRGPKAKNVKVYIKE